jgi:tetratricopeptide (TPR) repeat protein
LQIHQDSECPMDRSYLLAIRISFVIKSAQASAVTPAKCDRCGVETNIPETFIRERKSFRRSIGIYCPPCWQKRQNRVYGWLYISNGALGIGGLMLLLAESTRPAGFVLTNLCLLTLFEVTSVLPHELAHAWVGERVGLRVFRLIIGHGRPVFRRMLWRYDTEFRSIPLGGLTLAAHTHKRAFRVRQFAFVLAGPLVNGALAASMLLFMPLEELWQFHRLEQGIYPGQMFFFANAVLLMASLWPHEMATALGRTPSDGKLLFRTLFLKPDTMDQQHAAWFAGEGAICHEKGEHADAQAWFEKGLAVYPYQPHLLNWLGVVCIESQQYEKARDCFVKLLDRPDTAPAFRSLLLNNIAYADVLLGGSERITEADRFSREAMATLGWVPAIKGTRGTVLIESGRIEEGLGLLHEAMAATESTSDKAQNACWIAMGEARMGNLIASQRYLDQARQLDARCNLLERAGAVLRHAELGRAGPGVAE